MILVTIDLNYNPSDSHIVYSKGHRCMYIYVECMHNMVHVKCTVTPLHSYYCGWVLHKFIRYLFFSCVLIPPLSPSPSSSSSLLLLLLPLSSSFPPSQSYPAVLSDAGPSPYDSPMEAPGSVIPTDVTSITTTTSNGSVQYTYICRVSFQSVIPIPLESHSSTTTVSFPSSGNSTHCLHMH